MPGHAPARRPLSSLIQYTKFFDELTMVRCCYDDDVSSAANLMHL